MGLLDNECVVNWLERSLRGAEKFQCKVCKNFFTLRYKRNEFGKETKWFACACGRAQKEVRDGGNVRIEYYDGGLRKVEKFREDPKAR